MCNLYSLSKGQAAIRTWFGLARDETGNLPELPAIFPDTMAPVIRLVEAERRLDRMRWGMPAPPHLGAAYLTNIRNAQSPHWRRWLGPENRCLVPATAFCEYAPTKPRKTPTWFARANDRPLFAFAGLWTAWRGVRGSKREQVEGVHLLFAFFTCAANDVVAPVHAKAMPVVLTEEREWDAWLRAPWSEASALQRPVGEDVLIIVARGERRDDGRAV